MTALTATPMSARTTATRCRVGLEDIAEEGRSLAGAPTAFNVAARVRAQQRQDAPLVRAWSIACLKAAASCVFWMRRPLMKKVGVPLTPTLAASF
jgi:hypothetical protein